MQDEVSAPYVDHGDVLFLIAKYLRAHGLATSAMALVRESHVDTAWLCGASQEMQLLREWIFSGDFGKATAFMQPLSSALTQEEYSAAMGVIEKQQLLESFFSRHGEVSRKQRQVILEELKTRKELHLEKNELDRCLEALLEREGADLRTPPAHQHKTRPWNVVEARLQCFEKLVPIFRDEIGPDEDEHKYLTMPPEQLVYLIQDAVQYNSANASAKGEHVDCISIAYADALRRTPSPEQRGLPQHAALYLCEKNELDAESANRKTPAKMLSRSVDWSRMQSGFTFPDDAGKKSVACRQPEAFADSQIARAKPHPLSMSMSSDRNYTKQATRITRRRQRSSADRELLLEENEEGETDSGGEGGVPHVVFHASQESSNALQPKALCDSATQTEEPNSTATNSSNVLAADATHSCDAEEESDTSRYKRTASILEAKGFHFSPSPSEKLDQSAAVWMSMQKMEGSFDAGVQPFETQSPQKRSMYTSYESGLSQSLCVDDDDDPSALPSISSKSPISKYFEEEEDAEEERSFVGEEEQLRPERYDQLTADHIVKACVVAEVKEAHAVRAIDLSRDGAQLAIGTNARALRVFDLESALRTATNATTRVPTSSFSPHHHHASFLLPLLPVVMERHKHHQSAIYCVAYNHSMERDSSPSLQRSSSCNGGEVVASGAADSSIKVLSLATNKETLLQNHPGKTRALHFSTPNRLWSTCTGDLRIRCWDLECSLTSSCLDLDGHVGEIQTFAFSHDKDTSTPWLLSASLDKTIRLWDPRSGKCERIVARTAHPAFTIQCHPLESHYFASGHQNGSVSLWDLRMKKNRPLDTLAHHQEECRAISWSPDGAWLLSSSFDGTICVMQTDHRQTSTLSALASYHQHQDKVLQAQWHPRKPAIVTTGADKLVKLWTFS